MRIHTNRMAGLAMRSVPPALTFEFGRRDRATAFAGSVRNGKVFEKTSLRNIFQTRNKIVKG